MMMSPTAANPACVQAQLVPELTNIPAMVPMLVVLNSLTMSSIDMSPDDLTGMCEDPNIL
jgi:hypothetical protein